MVSEELPETTGSSRPGLSGGLVAGALVSGYRLEEQIGRGGMAVVFRARDERLGRLVALKVLGPELAADEGFRQRFLRESRAAAAVDDPHIIPVHEAGEAGGVLFIAMRYVPGGDVRTLLQREGPLAAGRVAAIISAVASALDAAHGQGLVHRDIKPANMLLDVRPGRPDHVYLSDFGLSKAWEGSTGLTGTGLFLGTVDYAAPEQIEGRAVDGRADQYALGCAAFELLAGDPPFRRDQGMAVMYAHLSAPPPSLTERRPALAPEVDAVFGRVLAKSPDERYARCGEFADALRSALGLPGYDADREDASPRTQPATVITSQGREEQARQPGDRVADVTGNRTRDDNETAAGAIPAGTAAAMPPGERTHGAGDRAPARRRRTTLVLILAGTAAVAAGVAAAIVFSPGRPPPALTPASNAAFRSGAEVFVGTGDSFSTDYALTATGVFAGSGALKNIGSGHAESLATLRGGTFVFNTPSAGANVTESRNATTCVLKFEMTGTYTIDQGTGKYSGIAGSGTIHLIGTGTDPRKDNKCNFNSAQPVPGTVHAVIHLTGPVTLP
jgi:serine/threonine-protein kinase